MVTSKASRLLVCVPILLIMLFSSAGLPSLNSFNAQFGASAFNAQSSTQPVTISHQNGSIIFQTEHTAIAFDDSTGSIASIKNLLTGQFTRLDADYPLWQISTTNGSYSYSSTLKSFSYLETPNSELLMTWDLPQPFFIVQVVVKADAYDGGVDMGINVTNPTNSNVTIVSVDFPYIAGFTALDKSFASSDILAVPRRDGLIIPDFQTALSQSGTIRFEYTGSLTMQFFLIYDNQIGGIYEGVEDAQSSFKSLEIQNYTYGAPSFKFFWELYAPLIYPGNQFTTNYFVTIAGFQGESWEDGALLYRSWAQTQFYVEKGALMTRTDIPNWFKDLGLIWKIGPPINGTNGIASVASTVSGEFPNATTLLDLWGWNRYGFDSGYGNYFPPMSGESTLQSAISQINNIGDKVIFFFSGVLYDENGTENPNFPNIKQNLIVIQNGELYTTKESNGEVMAVPDPTTQWWQDQLVNFSVTAVKDYGAGGVYLDGLADEPVILNYRNASAPTLSGSTFWQAYSRILTNITNSMRQYNPSAITTAEGEAEVFIPYVDGFWVNMDQDNPSNTGIVGAIEIPMFSFVYHEYSVSYGTPYSYTPYNIGGLSYHDLFRYTLSKALTYGLVIRPDLGGKAGSVLARPDFSFLSSALQLEQDYSAYLRFGQMLPSPWINSVTVPYYFAKNNTITSTLTVPAVSGGLYQSSNGSDLLVISNPTSTVQNFSMQFYNGEFGYGTLQSVRVCGLDYEANNCAVTNSSGYLNNVSVGNLSNIVLRVYPSLQGSTSGSSTTSTGSTPGSSSGQFVLPWYVIPSVVSVIIVCSATSVAFLRKRNR